MGGWGKGVGGGERRRGMGGRKGGKWKDCVVCRFREGEGRKEGRL